MNESQQTSDSPTMTDEQKFIFDLKGWLLIPSVLQPDEIEAVKNHLYTVRDNPESLPEHERNSYSGPCATLLDHPAAVSVLREIIAPDKILRNIEPKDPGPYEAYGFRCDHSYYQLRSHGSPPVNQPHNGAVELFPAHQYRVLNGSICSPVTRVVWELNPVKKGLGGTLFLSGSHKSNFKVPEARRKIGDPLFETYECPAGSAVVLSEAVCHSSAAWLDKEHDRVAILNHYLHVSMKWHAGGPSYETVMAMQPKCRTLFRGVWVGGARMNNREYSADNRAS